MRMNTYLNVLEHREEPVKLNEIPGDLHEDILHFMYGRTVSKIDGEFAFSPSDYNEWVDKLTVKGADYDIVVQ